MDYKKNINKMLEDIDDPKILRYIHIIVEDIHRDHKKVDWYTLEYAAEGKEFFERFHKKMEAKMLWFTDCKAIEYDGFGSFSKILEKHRAVQICTPSSW